MKVSNPNRRTSQWRRPRRAARWFFTAALVVVLGFSAFASNAFAQQSLENLLAAFLYQFTKFVEWPEDEDSGESGAMNICVMGNDDLFDVLVDSVEGKSVNGRTIAIKLHSATDDTDACHILFLDESLGSQLDNEVEHHSDQAVLTVSTSDSFTREGGIVRLFRKDTKLGIEVNMDAAERAELKISSRLLELARIVRDEESE